MVFFLKKPMKIFIVQKSDYWQGNMKGVQVLKCYASNTNFENLFLMQATEECIANYERVIAINFLKKTDSLKQVEE